MNVYAYAHATVSRNLKVAIYTDDNSVMMCELQAVVVLWNMYRCCP